MQHFARHDFAEIIRNREESQQATVSKRSERFEKKIE